MYQLTLVRDPESGRNLFRFLQRIRGGSRVRTQALALAQNSPFSCWLCNLYSQPVLVQYHLTGSPIPSPGGGRNKRGSRVLASDPAPCEALGYSLPIPGPVLCHESFRQDHLSGLSHIKFSDCLFSTDSLTKPSRANVPHRSPLEGLVVASGEKQSCREVIGLGTGAPQEILRNSFGLRGSYSSSDSQRAQS